MDVWLESLAFRLANADRAFDNHQRATAGSYPLLPAIRSIEWREFPRRDRYLFIAQTIAQPNGIKSASGTLNTNGESNV